ncbi:hypothetical protein PM082_011054 [Marasmius tenuissimus]|nr:hypothetical protein PM082_011054 [Marasmius tenuissimus]
MVTAGDSGFSGNESTDPESCSTSSRDESRIQHAHYSSGILHHQPPGFARTLEPFWTTLPLIFYVDRPTYLRNEVSHASSCLFVTIGHPWPSAAPLVITTAKNGNMRDDGGGRGKTIRETSTPSGPRISRSMLPPSCIGHGRGSEYHRRAQLA